MIKVFIGSTDFSGNLKIAIIDEHPDGRVFAVQPVELVLKEIPDNLEIPVAFNFGRIMSQQFLVAMAEALDKHGVKTDKDAKIQGTLEATKYHLEDLRKLLKLNL